MYKFLVFLFVFSFRTVYDSEASCDRHTRQPYCTCDIVIDLLEALIRATDDARTAKDN